MPPAFPRLRSLAMLAAALLPAATLAQQQLPLPDRPPAPLEGRPKWEAGVIVGGGRVADYPGAAQSQTRSLVAPVLVYRGPVLRVDRDGIRGRLARSSDWELDLSLSAAFNARDNEARRGMDDLDYLFGIGPQLLYTGWRDAPGSPTLLLNARAVMSTDFGGIRRHGAVFDPELRWSLGRLAGTPARLTFGLQPTWGSRGLHRLFYEVRPEEARPDRPAYRARAGYLGTEFKLTLSQRASESVTWFAGLRLLSLHGAANDASPLLLDKTNLGLGVGLLWTPWRSTARAVD